MTPKFETKIIPLITNPEAQGYDRKGLALQSSLPTLSTALEGFERGELVAITAPPGMGKTMLARTLCMDLIKQNVKCLYISFELTYGQLLRLFKLSGLELSNHKDLVLSPVDYSERDIAFIEAIVEANELDVVVVDDIHSLEEKYSRFRSSDNMALVMRGLAQRLKNLAIKQNVVIITMAHQRKDALDNKSSSLSDIAYSGGIAQVSDTVLSIKTEKDTGYAIIEITKSRWSGKKTKVKAKEDNKIFKELAFWEIEPDEVVERAKQWNT